MWQRFLLKACVIVLYTLVAFGCGILLSMLLCPPAHAREPVAYHCQEFMYPRMQCEAKNVYPYAPVWSVYLNGVKVEHEDGINAYITIADEWERVEACILNHCVTFYARWQGNRLYFKGDEP